MIRRLSGILTALLLACSLLPSPAHADEPADAIVARVLEAYGGGAAVARVRSVTARGTLTDLFAGREGEYRRYLQRPGRLRIETMPEPGGETRILDRGAAWQSTATGGLAPARPMTRSAMIYQYTCLDLPMGLVDHAVPVAYGGRQLVAGREVQLLILAPEGGPEVRVYVDTDRHLIRRVAATFSLGMMGGSELATEYDDFRPEDGVLFPRLLTNYAGSTKISEIVLRSLAVNPPLDNALFAPPPQPPLPRP